jgi:phosphoglycolate phosphatase
MKTNKMQIIFDMDGTLSDTAKATSVAISDAVKKLNLPTVTYERILDAMGLPGLEFHAYIHQTATHEQLLEIERIVDTREQEEVRKWGRGILFPGVIKMLDKIKNQGHDLHIASTGSETHVFNTLATTDIKEYFTSIHCGRGVKINMVRDIIGMQNPTDCLMVGDMYKDAEAARGNNILALGAGFGYLSKKDRVLFDAVLETPNDIFKYI